MNKKIISLLALFPILVCCGSNNNPGEEDKHAPGGDDSTPGVVPHEEEKITYKDIYHYEYAKSSQLFGKKLYRASDGYIENTEQGYNNFFYQMKNSDGYSNLVYEGDSFKFNGVEIKGAEMTSIEGASAVRCFVAPESGNARISGSVYLLEGTSAHLEIYVNNSLICEKDVDFDGVFHSNDVTLTQGNNVYFVIVGNAKVSYNPVIDYTLSE